MQEYKQKSIDNAKSHTLVDKEKARVMRHVAKPAVYIPRLFVISPEKRAYLKRFGSRPAKKRREVVLEGN